jgi:hypothetical protein
MFLLPVGMLLLTSPVDVAAEERILILSPQGSVSAGQRVIFRIQAQDFILPVQAVLHYRTIGASNYQAVPMNQDTPIEFSGVIDQDWILPPGIEYFFEVVDGRGRPTTLPRRDPQRSPLRIDVSLDRPEVEGIVFPAMDNQRIQDRRPRVTIRFADSGLPPQWASVRLLLDDTDVTPIATITPEAIGFAPEWDLAYGNHRVTLEVMDAAGNLLPPQEWAFIIPHSDAFDRVSVDVRVDTELAHEVYRKNDSAFPDWTVQSSQTLLANMEKGDFRASVEANTWYITQDGPDPLEDDYNLNNYLVQLEYRNQHLAIGDVNVTGTELISETIARRGGVLTLNAGGVTAQGFMLSSDYLTGFDDMVGVDDSDNRLDGGSIEGALMDNNRLTLKGTVVTGKNEDNDDYNAGTLAAGHKGTIYSAQLTSSLFEEMLDLTVEYSVSDYDEDTSDRIDSDGDDAWLVRFSGRAGSYDYGGAYKYLSEDFQSVVTPTAPTNRAEYSLYGNKTFDVATLSANVSHIRDNVAKSSLLSVVDNTNAGLSLNCYPPDWPTFFMNALFSWQDSSDEPTGTAPLDNRRDSLGGGFSYVRDTWSISPSYLFTNFDDDTPDDADSHSHNVTVNAGWQPLDMLSFTPLVSYTRTDTDFDDVVTETWQATLGGMCLFNDAHNLNWTLSMTDTETDDDSLHIRTYNLIGQYNWHLRTPFLESVEKTLSLRGQYDRNEDKIADNDDEDYTVYLLLNIGIPLSYP